jgi:hypothetical protein
LASRPLLPRMVLRRLGQHPLAASSRRFSYFRFSSGSIADCFGVEFEGGLTYRMLQNRRGRCQHGRSAGHSGRHQTIVEAAPLVAFWRRSPERYPECLLEEEPLEKTRNGVHLGAAGHPHGYGLGLGCGHGHGHDDRGPSLDRSITHSPVQQRSHRSAQRPARYNAKGNQS